MSVLRVSFLAIAPILWPVLLSLPAQQDPGTFLVGYAAGMGSACLTVLGTFLVFIPFKFSFKIPS